MLPQRYHTASPPPYLYCRLAQTTSKSRQQSGAQSRPAAVPSIAALTKRLRLPRVANLRRSLLRPSRIPQWRRARKRAGTHSPGSRFWRPPVQGRLSDRWSSRTSKMGACVSSSENAEGDQKKRSQAIDRTLEEDSKKLRRECKILLLGR